MITINFVVFPAVFQPFLDLCRNPEDTKCSISHENTESFVDCLGLIHFN